jgi:hypothetical protein
MTTEQLEKEAINFYRQICHLKDQNRALYYLGMWLSRAFPWTQSSQLLTIINKLLIQYKDNPDSAPKVEVWFKSVTGCELA